MKRIILFLLIPVSGFSQSLNENPYLDYYLNSHLHESALGMLLGRNYTGFAKAELAKNTPSSWVMGYSLNHLPSTARRTGYDSPFGQSYMRVSAAPRKTTSLEFRGSHFGEMDAGMRGKYHLDKQKKVTTGWLLNYHHYKGERDKNADGFIDLSQKQRFFGINSWGFKLGDLKTSITGYHLRLDETGGQLGFDKGEHYLGNSVYGMGADLKHTGIGIQNEVVIKNKNTQAQVGSVYFDGDVRFSDITRFFGEKAYVGQEEIWNTYLGYAFKKRMTNWDFGLRYRDESVNENIRLLGDFFSYENQELGAYAKAKTKIGLLFRLEAGLRADYDFNRKEALLHPDAGITYLPFKNAVLTLFASRGSRDVTPLNENSRYLFSNREILVPDALQKEQAWQYGASFRWRSGRWYGYDFFKLGNIHYYFLFYHNIYQNVVLSELGAESDHNTLTFRNHRGRAYQTSLNNRLSLVPFRGGYLTLMHGFEVFRTDASGEMRDRIFRPRQRFMMSFDYSQMRYFTLNVKYHLAGRVSAPMGVFPDGQSPRRSRWDIGTEIPLSSYIARGDVFKKMDLLLGVDNLTGKGEDYHIIGAGEPFSPNMDGGMNWGTPLRGRFYGGLRVDF